MNKLLVVAGFMGFISQGLANPCSTGMFGSCKNPQTALACLGKNYSDASNAITYMYNQGQKVKLGVEGKQLMLQNEEGETKGFPIKSSDDAKCLANLKGDLTPVMPENVISAYNRKIAQIQQNAARNAQRANSKALLAQRAAQETQEKLSNYTKEMLFIMKQLEQNDEGKTKLCLERNPIIDSMLRNKYRIEHGVSYNSRSNSYKQEAQAKCRKGMQYGSGGVMARIESILPKTFSAEVYLTLNPEIMNELNGQGGSLENAAENHYIAIGSKQKLKFLPTTLEEYSAVEAAGYKEKLEEIDQYFLDDNNRIWRS